VAKKRNSMQAAAAELVAAVAAETASDELLDEAAEEITADVLDGLRRLDQGGNRVTWYVYCDSPMEREGFVEKLKTEQLDEQRFKHKYGPGEYRVVGKQSDGQYVKGSHKTIKISPILAEDSRSQGGGNDAVSLLREMRTADDQRAAKRAEELKAYAGLLAAPLATLGAALITRRPAIDVAALVTALRPQQSSLTEMTTALVNLKAMQGDQGGGGVEVVLKVLERLQDLPQASGGGEIGWLGFLRDVIKETAPHVRELLAQVGQPKPPGLPPGSTTGPPFGPGVPKQLPQPSQANGSTPPPPVSAPLSSSQSAPAASEEGSDMWKLAEPWARLQAANLEAWASNNMEVELVAETLLKSVPKKFWLVLSPADVVQLMRAADWWERLTAFHPPLAPYQAWCDDVREELIATLEENIQNPPGEAPPAAPGPERAQ
jgi:hypothetical protein